MPVPDIFFSPRYDVHLLRGQTVALQSLLFVGGTDAASYQTANPTVSYTFTPLFKGTAAGNIFSGANIQVNTATGVVEALAAAPASEKRNFIVEVAASDSADPAGTDPKTTAIRIHIHNHVTQAWLTPATLTLRPSGAAMPQTTNYKFTIRAQFDDNTVGDVTYHDGITWGPAANVNANGRLIITAANTPGSAAVQITATLPATLENKVATGTINFGKDWEDENTIRTDVVVGGGWPGTINPQKVPNLLFLSDGYKPEDSGLFESQVNSFVHLLKNSQVTRPFDILATSMNIWKAFIPCQEHGISVLCEIYTKESGGKIKAYPVPDPEKPPAAGNWKISHLIYAAGLPVSTDVNADVAAIKTSWGQQLNPLPMDRISDDLINWWKSMGNRCFIEERNSVFGLAYGDPPSASEESESKIIDFHPRRMSRTTLDPVLRKLTDTVNHVDISDVWAERSDGTRPNSYKYIFLFSSAKWDRGVNYSRGYIAMNVEERNFFPVKAIVGKKTFDIDLTGNIRNTLSEGRMIRGAHELGHSFNLGDEYNEKGTMPAGTSIDERFSNLQKDADVRNPAGNIDGNKIKWRWHRIKKAGVIASAITAQAGDKFRVPLQLGHGNQFAQGDTVLLRFREFPKALKTDTKVSVQMEVAEAPASDAIVIKAKAGFTFTAANIADFPPGSIVYIPVEAKASVRSADYPFAELIAKNIKDHITTRNRALNIDPASPQACTGDHEAIQQPVALNVSLPFCFKNKPKIVGLFTGGATYDCGVYHPTGSCIMRNSNEDGKEFCAVCRYVLVDTIDPSKHWEINRDYEEIYPQT